MKEFFNGVQELFETVLFACFLIGNCFHLLPQDPHWTVLPLAVIAWSGTTNFFSHELQLKIIINQYYSYLTKLH